MKLPKDHITELACSKKQNQPTLEKSPQEQRQDKLQALEELALAKWLWNSTRTRAK